MQLSKQLSITLSLVFIALIILQTLGILRLNRFISLNILTLIICILGMVSIIDYMKSVKKERQKRISATLKYALLGALTLSIILISLQPNWFKLYDAPLYIIITSAAIVLFWQNHKIINKIEDDVIKERAEEEKRKNKFNSCFPAINKIPCLRHIARWLHKEKLVYSISLILIFALFIAIKLPYNDQTFTGIMDMKYQSYVSTAVNMYENNNPFLVLKQYDGRPITKPDGRGGGLIIPVIEWPLMAMFYIFYPKLSYEFITRLFMSLLGITLLTSIYYFLKSFTKKLYALFIILFLAFNPLINFVSFLTVGDTPMFVFIFLSLYFINKHYNKKDNKQLFNAAIFAGLAVLTKLTALIILYPIVILLLLKENKFHSAIVKASAFCSLSFIVYAMYRITITKTPSYTSILPFILSGMGVVFGIFILRKTYLKFDLILRKSEETISKFLQDKKLILIGSSIALFLSVIFFFLFDLFKFTREFFTDMSLLFNLELYKQIIIRQMSEFLNPFFYYFFFIALAVILISKYNYRYNTKNTLICFFIGASTYLILTSKVIFFHKYYKIIFVILSVVFCVIFLGFFSEMFTKKLTKAVFIFLMALIFICFIKIDLASIEHFIGSQKEDVIEAAQYLKDNTVPYERYFGVNTHELAFYAGRIQYNLIALSGVDYINFSQEIEKQGFLNTMDKYNVRYYVLYCNNQDICSNAFNRLEYLFDSQSNQKISKRTELILGQLGQKKNIKTDSSLKEMHNIEDYFDLAKEIGRYKFYKVKD